MAGSRCTKIQVYKPVCLAPGIQRIHKHYHRTIFIKLPVVGSVKVIQYILCNYNIDGCRYQHILLVDSKQNKPIGKGVCNALQLLPRK